MSERSPDFFIMAHYPLSRSVALELMSEADKVGISYETEEKGQVFYASMEWLIPAGISVIFLKAYFDGFAKKVGEDHYIWLKEGMRGFYNKFFGSNPEVAMRIVSDGVIKPESHFSRNLSVFYRLDSGHTLKLLFPVEITEADYVESCKKFMELIIEYIENSRASLLQREIDQRLLMRAEKLGVPVDDPSAHWPGVILLYWNPIHGRFHVPDAVESSRQKRFVDRPIGVASCCN